MVERYLGGKMKDQQLKDEGTKDNKCSLGTQSFRRELQKRYSPILVFKDTRNFSAFTISRDAFNE
jgi:hypothetical protein